ncbi:hypothetical protein [Micromonospora noduli]|uniref:Uncharacterized protein n=1 Tax=Micromonospora noduli TaxID=709876 RepID=A0A328MZ44_9ACTN|nr:hypothetical protein [Micromonospora noduli]RAN98244.1 hypothetical protein LAH08_04228 [Micromonospora noduli]
MVDYPVGPWARERFGERAGHVCAALVGALQQALTDAQNAHKEGKSKKLFTFGSAQATRRYECIVEALKGMDGIQTIKPKGSPHELVVLDGNLIYPFRYATDSSRPIQRARVTEKKVSGLIAELFTFYGPEPQQPSLFDPVDEFTEGDVVEGRTPVLTTLPEGTRLALLAYASDDRSGVLNAWLGEGELGHRGRVQWLQVEQLPLTAPDSRSDEGRGQGRSGPLGPVPGPRLSGPTGPGGSAAAERRFDDGAMPNVPLTARAPVERANTDQFPPQTERAPQEPNADDQDR